MEKSQPFNFPFLQFLNSDYTKALATVQILKVVGILWSASSKSPSRIGNIRGLGTDHIILMSYARPLASQNFEHNQSQGKVNTSKLSYKHEPQT